MLTPFPDNATARRNLALAALDDPKVAVNARPAEGGVGLFHLSGRPLAVPDVMVIL
jgi:hypothetical protein